MLKKLKRFIVASLMIVTVAGCVSMAVSAQTDQLSLRSADGRDVKLSELRGKVVLLLFGGTFVPLASRELPSLQKIADRYSARGVQVYWVSINSNKPGARNYASDQDLQAFAQKYNLRVTILRDPDQEAYRAFGLDALPTALILDRQGKVFRKQVGLGTDQSDTNNEIIRGLEQLLK